MAEDEKLLSQIKALFITVRPANVIITFISVWVAALLSKPFSEIPALQVSLGALAAALIGAYGNVHNDILDIEVDRINRRERPLPQGMVSTRTAGVFAALLVAAGIAIGWFLGTAPFLITFTAAFLLFLYNYRLKMVPLWGNLTVSFLTALAFVFGGVLSGNPAGGTIPAVLSLFFHFSREMVKDIDDLKGDSQRPGITFVQKFGVLRARNTAIISLVMLILLIPIPYFAHYYKIAYLYISLIGVVIPVLWVVWSLLMYKNPNYRQISNILKTGMVFGLIALMAGR